MSEAVENIQVRERFEVDNDMKAEWCLSKIRKVKAEASKEIAELERQMNFYKDQIEMIETKVAEEEAFFTGILQEYFKHRVDDGFTKSTKTQTVYKLPTGRLILKKQEPTFDRIDDLLLAWTKKNRPEFVKTEESTDWAKLKKECVVVDGKAVTKDGEIVEGVAVTEREDKFIVEE